MNGESFSVVVPTCGSSPRLGRLLRELDAQARLTKVPYEVLLVLDGPSDAIALETPSSVRKIPIKRRSGQNAATLRGIQEARYERILTFDDDARFSAERLPALLEALGQGADLAYAPNPLRPERWRRITSRMARAAALLANASPLAAGVSSCRGFLRSRLATPCGQIDAALVSRAKRIQFLPSTEGYEVPVSPSRYSLRDLWRHAASSWRAWSKHNAPVPNWTPLAEESRHFGISIVRADPKDGSSAGDLVEATWASDVDLIVSRIDSREVPLVQSFEREGFFLTDSLIYFSIDMKRVPPASLPAHLTAERPDAAASRDVVALTRKCFRSFFGHYHCDPHLSASLCDELYAQWISNSCASTDPRSEARLFRARGVPVAFASARMRNERHGEALLAGVAPDYQGQGIYADVVRYGMEWARERGARYFWASTHASHMVVQQSLIKLGFIPRYGVFTLHAWPRRLKNK